ncbi:MAG: PAS domain-containing sensor histidine kinase, partial [Bacteroidota bacterium]
RKRAEEALREREQRLSSIYDTTADVIFHLEVESDERYRFVSVNKAFVSTTGIGFDQVVGQLVNDIIPEPSLTLVLGNYREAISGKKIVRWEETSNYPTGTLTGEVSVAPVFDEDGNCTHLVGAVHDITQRKRAEEEIRRLNEELEQRVIDRTAQLEAANKQLRMFVAMADSSFDFVSLANLQGEIFYLNPGGRKLMGLGHEEEPPKAIAAYCEPATWELIQREGLPGVLHKGKWEGEGRLRNFRTGELWDVAMRTFIVSNPTTGEPLCMAAINSNITDRKRAEAEIARRSIELESVNKELEAFSYSVSHDLRAPLRHIDGFGDLLLKNAADKLDEKSTRYLNTISQSAKHMGELIDDLLVFSRMGRTELQATRVDMGAMVREAIQNLSHDVGKRKIQWNVHPLPRVSADPSMIRLVWQNLLGNAIKYTRPRERATIEIGSVASDGEAVFSVRDNGVGFDMKYADKLFGVFQRLHRADEFEGTGIGLANVHRIVARHGGKTWAESELGKGAVFYFSLPLSETGGQ